jgi:site-specific DNA-methyltransferase (adenine-specific)
MTAIFKEVWRVLKPGGHSLVWALPRTQHWTATAVEDAGFDVRDVIAHNFFSGFPKSLDISRVLDEAAGVEREVIGQKKAPVSPGFSSAIYQTKNFGQKMINVTAPTSPAAKTWAGWGTALKPSHESWILGRKPLSGTVIANVTQWRTGGINIDACRVAPEGADSPASGQATPKSIETIEAEKGLWPPNMLLSHGWDCGKECAPGCPVAELNRQAEDEESASSTFPCFDYAHEQIEKEGGVFHAFHYFPKPSRAEKEAGCLDLPGLKNGLPQDSDDASEGTDTDVEEIHNVHPTVKSIALMRWLCRLVTPKGGTVLDPFSGSGTTGCAAVLEGFDFVGIEREAEYAAIARARIAYWSRQSPVLTKSPKIVAPRPGQLGLFGGSERPTPSKETP